MEQQNKPSESKRFKAIGNFLEEVVKVVPLESVLDAIAYEKYEIALNCAEALKKRKPQLQLSKQMIISARRAAIRASYGYEGEIIDKVIIPFIQMFQEVIVPTIQQGQGEYLRHPSPLQMSQQQTQVKSTHKQRPLSHKHQPQPLEVSPSMQKIRPKKRGIKPMYSTVASKRVGSELHSPTGSFSQPMVLPPLGMLTISIKFDRGPLPRPFPSHMVEYLQSCFAELQKLAYMSCRVPNAVSDANIEEVYSVSGSRKMFFKSPLQVLRKAMEEIATYTEIMQQESSQLSPQTTMHDKQQQMLELVDKIYQRDIAVCVSLLGAFMEQQIRIPLLKSAKDTAETLSNAAPVAVGVWALFSLNLADLQKVLCSASHNVLIVEIRQYIEGISQQLQENEDRMYAGKLQFLLQGIKETVTASSQYISYSLEHQLCKNLKFNKTIPLNSLIRDWDDIFKNDSLSLIARSHRPLVARWLKWTILVHDLREALAEYTCIGIMGLVNSGKSLLVRELFKIEVNGFFHYCDPNNLHQFIIISESEGWYQGSETYCSTSTVQFG